MTASSRPCLLIIPKQMFSLFSAVLLSACSSSSGLEVASPPIAVESCVVKEPRHAVSIDSETAKRLEAVVRQYVDAGIAPGAVLQIEQEGDPVVSFAYGVSDLKSEKQMESDALFRLYSMTKPITSLASMRFVESGQISLDDPVGDYLPEFRQSRVSGGDFRPGQPILRPISIRDLLTQTAGIAYRTDQDSIGRIYARKGIPAGPGVADPPTDGSPPVESLAELSTRVADTPLRTHPGDAWSYGNATDVLGRVLEVVTGKTLEQVLREEVLQPIGMNDTSFTVSPQQQSRLTSAYINPMPKQSGSGVLDNLNADELVRPNLIVADPADASIFSSQPGIAFGGAGLAGTANDYLRLTRMLRSGGEIDGTRVVTQRSIELMRSNHLADPVRKSAETLGGLGFGLGFAVKDRPIAGKEFFPECAYFWGGAASTFFWIDPAGEISGVLMTQVFGGDTSSMWIAVLRELYSSQPG